MSVRRGGPCTALLLWIAVAPAVASAETSEPAPAPDQGHRHQLGLGLQTGIGMRGIKPYESEYCGARSPDSGDAAACVGRAPMALDVLLTWGAGASIELLTEIRVGIERDFGPTDGAGGGPRLFHLAPGARFYFAASERASFFSTAQLAIDFTGYRDAFGEARVTDVALRNVNGLMIDVHRAYGFYVHVGETLGFRRWLWGELELGIGVQGRYP